MDANRESGYRIVSTGTVVADKKLGDHTIQVRPDEHRTLGNGPIGGDTIKYDTKLQDKDGIVKPDKMTGGDTITATWRAFGATNRSTPPDVVNGEAVTIFGFADTQDYYWDKLGNEPGLRRLEHVVYSFSNLPKGREAYNADTSYWIMVSTVQKKVQLHTSANDGEAVTYDLILDTKNGTVSLQDDAGNSLVLDSVGKTLKGVIGEEIDLTTKRIKMNASENITATTPEFTVDGHLTVTKGFSFANSGGNSVGQMTGNVELNGDLTATGKIMDGEGNSNHHDHPQYVLK